MALLTTWGATNRVIQESLDIHYSKQRATGNWTYASGTSLITLYECWQYQRTASMSYRYEGMDETTATSCANAVRNAYNRSTLTSKFNGSGANVGEFTDQDGGTMVMADVSCRHREGGMYDVEVRVRETDTKCRVMSVTPSALFAVENQREYATEHG